MVDPFGLSTIPAVAETLGDRSDGFNSAVEELGLGTPAPSTPLEGSWDALPDPGAIPVVPAQAPAEDEELVVLTEEEPSGAAPAGLVLGRLAQEDPPPTPVEVDLGGLEVVVSPVSEEVTPATVLLRVAGESETDAAGITGVLLEVTDASSVPATDPEVELTVSYATFAGLGAGDWAARLQYVWVPDCDTAGESCVPIPIETTNNLAAQTVTAVVPVAPGESIAPASFTRATAPLPGRVMDGGAGGGSLAITAGTSSAAGDWGATSLSPTSSWGNSGSTGAFTWSLPIGVPSATAGPAPQLGLSYSSAASDGRTPSTNNQSGTVGEGFGITEGYVERSYTACSQDETGAANNIDRISGDLCWGKENATMSFNGSTVELIRDATTGDWHPKHEDGTKVERLTGSFNSGQANEYWKVTTSDGIQYFFGRNKITATSPALNSAWTVPVYGNHPGEACHQTSFADSSCTQVWRWNLDYVVDPSGNSMTYFYDIETNRYVYDVTDNPDAETRSYVSGGHVTRIDYGTRAGEESTGSAPAKVELNYHPRCITDLNDSDSFCGPAQTSTSSNHWLDTPVDLVCTSSAPNTCENYTPVFFDRTRLASLTTSTLDGTSYQPVDTWSLNHTFDGGGVGVPLEFATNVVLVLRSVTRTGQGGTTSTADDITSPPFNFSYDFMANRIATSMLSLPLARPRVIGIRTDSGAQISVNYRTDCAENDVPGISEAAQAANDRLCFPVKWSMGNGSGTLEEYFHKYVVDSIVESGSAPSDTDANVLNTGSVATVTTFDYSGGAAWAKPTGAMVDPDEITYSDFRGMATVTTTIGVEGDQSSSRVTYFQGMGATLQANGISVVDHERFKGQPFLSATLNGPTLTAELITVPGVPATAAENAAGRLATRIPSSSTHSFTYDAAGALVHRTQVTQQFDEYGQVATIDDFGDVSTAADNTCTSMEYAHTSSTVLHSKHLVGRLAQTTVSMGSCPFTSTSPADLLSSQRTTYDDNGNPLRTERLDPTDGVGFILSNEILAYDNRGRALEASDALGNVSSIQYLDSTGGLTQSTVKTSPDPDGAGTQSGFQQVTSFNPLTGQIIASEDANGLTTTRTYDALGRLLTVRLPQHNGLTLPSVQHEYTISEGGLNSVLTRTLNADGTNQQVSVVLYDGLLRAFQTQSSGMDSGPDHDYSAGDRGRMVTHTYYDSAGRVDRKTGQWWAQGVPAATPVDPIAVPPSMTTYEYDGAGRPTAEVFWVGTHSEPGNERWRTETVYRGATTLLIPPTGATPEATLVDARGRVIERTLYERDPDDDADANTATEVFALESQSTRYTYDVLGQLTELRDSDNNAWGYEYDWGGRQISANDPDGGTTTNSYDALNRVVTVTNANGQTLAYTYDNLGRADSLRDNSVTGTIRSKWTYDTALNENGDPVLGQLASATRYVDGHPYTSTVGRYDSAYRPLETTFELPDISDYDSLGSLTFTNQYNYTIGGQVSSVSLPAIEPVVGPKALGAETVTTHYNSSSMPSWMSGGFGWGTYVAETRFAADGRTLAADLGNTYGSYLTYGYEQGTNRLTGIRLDRQGLGTGLNLTYGYDAAGNVVSIEDQPTANAATQDNQCFGIDGLRRLQVAWTALDGDCSTAQGNITTADVGGAQPYWTEFAYDDVGNRTSMVEHGLGSTPTTTSAYTLGTGEASPHQMVEVTETTAGTSTETEFTYDAAGNRTSRSIDSNDVSTYAWDAEGELVADDNYTYIYDASGNRIVRKSESATTVYLPGGQEITIDGNAVSAIRSYTFGGVTVAIRTSNGLGGVTSLVSDRDGSVVAAIPNTEWTPTSLARVYSDPFGGIRGDSDADLPGDRRFLGATRDADSGLTLLGARYYDAAVGCFISVDPVLNLNVPAHLHAYAYGFNNPVTFSDASGLEPRTRDGKYDGNPYGGTPNSNTGGGSTSGSSQEAVEPGWPTPDQWQDIGAVFLGIGVGVLVTAAVLAVGACTVVTFGVCGVAAGVGIAAVVAGGVAATVVTYHYSSGDKTTNGYAQSALLGGVFGLAGPALGPVVRSALGKVTTGAASAGGNATGGAAAGAGSTASTSGISANQAAGNAARDAIMAQIPGAVPEQTIVTTLGVRRIDILTVDYVAIEVKVGRTSLTSVTEAQISKDQVLLKDGQVTAVEWIFQRSEVTGLGGPTGPLREALKDANIPWSEKG